MPPAGREVSSQIAQIVRPQDQRKDEEAGLAQPC
jgi:hypothetical protein